MPLLTRNCLAGILALLVCPWALGAACTLQTLSSAERIQELPPSAGRYADLNGDGIDEILGITDGNSMRWFVGQLEDGVLIRRYPEQQPSADTLTGLEVWQSAALSYVAVIYTRQTLVYAVSKGSLTPVLAHRIDREIYDARLADFQGTGKPEIIARQVDGFHVYSIDGVYQRPLGQGSFFVGDFLDHPGLELADVGQNFRVLLSDLASTAWAATVDGVGATAPAVGDFDGDGLDELVVALPDDLVLVDPNDDMLRVVGPGVWNVYRLGAGDLDGDGIDEILVSAPETTLGGSRVMDAYSGLTRFPLPEGPNRIEIAQLDNDAANEVVTHAYEHFRVRDATGATEYIALRQRLFRPQIEVLDADLDGEMEVLVGPQHAPVHSLNGDTLRTEESLGPATSYPFAIGDLYGDGAVDLVMVERGTNSETQFSALEFGSRRIAESPAMSYGPTPAEMTINAAGEVLVAEYFLGLYDAAQGAILARLAEKRARDLHPSPFGLGDRAVAFVSQGAVELFQDGVKLGAYPADGISDLLIQGAFAYVGVGPEVLVLDHQLQLVRTFVMTDAVEHLAFVRLGGEREALLVGMQHGRFAVVDLISAAQLGVFRLSDAYWSDDLSAIVEGDELSVWTLRDASLHQARLQTVPDRLVCSGFE